MKNERDLTLLQVLFPVLVLIFILVFGLTIYPLIADGATFSLEAIFIISATISGFYLVYLGYDYATIQKSMVEKLKQLMPAVLILCCIGIIIGAWVVSGTIPMLIYYAIDLINPGQIYLTAFLVCAVFSLCTGTSWGSAGTIGVVVMSVGVVMDVNLAILAAAIVGGSYFGDKMSPLSDTTNIAALAADVPLMSHVRSMMNTTGPAFIFAAIAYYFLGLNTALSSEVHTDTVIALQQSLYKLFHLNSSLNIFLLVVPVLIVLVGSLTQKPTVPTLLISAFIACIISIITQGYSLGSAIDVLINGYNADNMIHLSKQINDPLIVKAIARIVNRGGLYSMASGPVIISMAVFCYVGTLEVINAIPILVHRAFGHIRRKSSTIISTLIATMCTNGLTSNQFATSFIVAEAFKPKYKELGISKRVLSRSLEDAGTMIEGCLPWTTTGLYMYKILHVSPAQYAPYAFLTMFGLIIAVILAVTGKGCFYHEVAQEYAVDKMTVESK